MVRMAILPSGQRPPSRRWTGEAAVLERVRAICEEVRRRGDDALVELTRDLDGADVAGRIRISPAELEAAEREIAPELLAALERMAERLRGVHARQLPSAWESETDGVRFGEVIRPLAAAGCYVPGGRASYPSSVLMTAIPAAVAGVPRIAVCTPPGPDGSIPPAVLAAAALAGAGEVYRVGGAQAVAALAFGTGTIAPVDKVVGPGNAWVTAAKREVAGVVGIDGLAGPTELVIVADATADPEVLAADLVAQAEHDPQAEAMLVALDPDLPDRVNDALEAATAAAPRRDIVEAALEHATATVVADEGAAAEVVDELAPEHLQVVTAEPDRFVAGVRSFGAAFLGSHSPVSFGDYGVGSNHVLPTMGTARFASGLRAADFVTVSSFVEGSAAGVASFAAEVELVAASEG
ncbi:MAG TPA: histidinol dehydrogenase, partial [Actinomycetota bacterium]|nr:histidinol dehydrogenase [Actinomycetota bacterium]